MLFLFFSSVINKLFIETLIEIVYLRHTPSGLDDKYVRIFRERHKRLIIDAHIILAYERDSEIQWNN